MWPYDLSYIDTAYKSLGAKIQISSNPTHIFHAITPDLGLRSNLCKRINRCSILLYQDYTTTFKDQAAYAKYLDLISPQKPYCWKASPRIILENGIL